MISLSYTLTPLLQDHLKKIENLRRILLLTPLAPRVESALIYKASVTSPATQRAFNFIRYEWTGNPKPVKETDIEEIGLLLFPFDRSRVLREIQKKSRDIRHMLSYLEVKPEHPVIAASIIHYAFLTEPIIPWDDGTLARTISMVILAKSGYNIRGMIAPEAIIAESPQTYERELVITKRQKTITSWLEYYTKIIMTAMDRLAHELNNEPTKTLPLTSRQKTILSQLENPQNRMTNRAVQKIFKISQITASRDLSKLVAFGLLYPHGKGRSIYYTRI